jgi:nitrate reductase assembly molybdenum cofactor insertion protein NarJ
MTLDAVICDELAVCCDYPRDGLAERAMVAAGGLRSAPAQSDAARSVADALEKLAKWAGSVGTAAAEERYTQLFDLQPVATLNLSHHLLGDTYQRGALLAGLAGELKQFGISYEQDLPDHLSTLLRLLMRLDDPRDRWLLAHTIVLPGLRVVLERLESSPGAYPDLLGALCELIADEIPAGDEEVPELRKPSEVPSCSI